MLKTRNSAFFLVLALSYQAYRGAVASKREVDQKSARPLKSEKEARKKKEKCKGKSVNGGKLLVSDQQLSTVHKLSLHLVTTALNQFYSKNFTL